MSDQEIVEAVEDPVDLSGLGSGAGMGEACLVKRGDGRLNSDLAKVEGVVRGCGAGIKPGSGQPISQGGRSCKPGVRRRDHARHAEGDLEMADRPVDSSNDRRHLPEHRGEIVTFSPGIAGGAVDDRSVGEHIAGKQERDLGSVGCIGSTRDDEEHDRQGDRTDSFPGKRSGHGGNCG